MASSSSFPFAIEGAIGTEGSATAGFSLLATQIRNAKLVNRVSLGNGSTLRCMRVGQKTVALMSHRWRGSGSGMRIGGGSGGGSWRVLCSKSGNNKDSAEGEKDEEEDSLTATFEKKSKKIMALHSGILQKLEERRQLVAEFKLIIDEDISAQDREIPPFQEVSSSDKEDLNKQRNSASLPSITHQSPGGKAPEKPTKISKANLDVGSNNMDNVGKQGTSNLISSTNINYVPRLPEGSTSRRGSTSKESGRKPKRSSSPESFSRKIEDRPDLSTTRILNEINEIANSLNPNLAKSSPDSTGPLEGIPDVIAEEIRKSFSAAVSPLQEDKAKEPLVKDIIGAGTNSPSNEDVKHPPLAGENVMNVILVAAECSPWKKTGGLGDVAGALPKALARRGHRVMVVVPRYGNYADSQDMGVRKRYKVAGQDMEVNYFHAFIDGVDFVFIESPILRHIEDNIYGGNWIDILRRMTLFCKAAVEVPWHVPCGGICYGDGNLVFIANDWHTALLPVYLKAYYRDNGLMTYTRSVLVIHNIAHQGRGPLDTFSLLDLPGHYKEYFRLYDPVGGEHCNIFAAGIKTADRVVAVSHGYAWELKTNEGGWGLHNIINENHWKLQGIVNGIDYNEWNPQVDEHLKSDGYTNYSPETLQTGKAQCKAALQKELGLPVRPDVPLIGFIGRLDGQKGVDIIGEAIPWMMEQDVQLVMLGTGRLDLEEMLKRFESQYKDKVRGWVGFSVRTAHRITAGVDILLMPSRFEPCGLNQLYAMCYGTIPVVHSVGGLRDTVHPYDPFSDTGYGWTFDRAEAGKLVEALGYCLMTYRQYKQSWEGIQKRGMMQDLSWDHAAQIYEEVLVAAKYQW